MTTTIQITNAITRGEAILLTGAGFSHGLTALDGEPLPIGTELARSLWPIAFGEEAFDPATALSMVYEESLRRSPTLLREQLSRHFEIDRGQIPPRYKFWYSFPWHRIYTLNVDDSDEAVSELLDDQLQILSALSSTPGDVRHDRRAVVHVNGRLSEFPKVTFSPWDYAERSARQDAWYQEFVTDISTRPVVVVGSVLDESPLWHYLTLRGEKGSRHEMRPKSWLVTPKIDPGRRAMLQRLNFEHHADIEEEFYERVLAPVESDLASLGLAKPQREGALDTVDQMVRDANVGSPDFLLGVSPTWGDVVDGFAAAFKFDEELLEVVDGIASGAVLVTGSAGSGKSTSLMRAAATLSARGSSVLWLDRESEATIGQIKGDVRRLSPDYVFIDDLDRFAGDAPSLIRSLTQAADDVVLVCSARSVRFEQLRYGQRLPLKKLLRQERLTDDDARALLAQLSRANRLGALLKLPQDEQIGRIAKRGDRQLLVALIEATSGQRFHERIADECRSLKGPELAIYGLICTAMWADNRVLTKQDLLIGAIWSHEPNAALNALRRLEESHIIQLDSESYRARHRVVAESAIDYFREEGYLERWLESLIFLAATHYTLEDARKTRYGRLLIRLINHSALKRLVVDTATIQRIYGEIERWLLHDPHYWLQRGSFETDYGDLNSAENFLRQSRALLEDDARVDTAWSMLLLKRSVNSPSSPSAQEDVNEAFKLLQAVMADPTQNSPHTFVVYFKYALKWLRTAPLQQQEKASLRDDLRQWGKVASYRHRGAYDVEEAWRVAEAWLSLNAL